MKSQKNLSIILPIYFIIIAICASSLMWAFDSNGANQKWSLIVNHTHLDLDSKISFFSQQESSDLGNAEIQLEDSQGIKDRRQVSITNNMTFVKLLEKNKQNIKQIRVLSDKKLIFSGKGRLLFSENSFIPDKIPIGKFLSVFISFLRNAALLALFTNTFDLWMPLLVFIESFMMLGMFTLKIGYLTQFYTEIYKSKIDVFNFLRLAFSENSSPSQIRMLDKYGFTNNFFVNTSGEICILILLMIFSLGVKAANIAINNERLRSLNLKLRPISNGYICWMTPKLVVLAGLQFCLRPYQLFNYLSAGGAIVGVVTFLVLLFLQTRRINSKNSQYIKQMQQELGLTSRISYKRAFEFDFIEFSMLYYPFVNQVRITAMFLCVGFSAKNHTVQQGAVLIGQFVSMMMLVCCSPYMKTRDKLVYPILDFMFLAYLLSQVLNVIVAAPQNAGQFQKFQLSLLGSILFIILLCIIADCVAIFKKNCKMAQNDTNQDLPEAEKKQSNHVTIKKTVKLQKKEGKQNNQFELKPEDVNQTFEGDTVKYSKQNITEEMTIEPKKIRVFAAEEISILKGKNSANGRNIAKNNRNNDVKAQLRTTIAPNVQINQQKMTVDKRKNKKII